MDKGRRIDWNPTRIGNEQHWYPLLVKEKLYILRNPNNFNRLPIIAWQFLKYTYLPPPQVGQSNNFALSLQNRLIQCINTPLPDTEQSREPDEGDQHGNET